MKPVPVKWGRLATLIAGAAAGAYLVDRWRRDGVRRPPPLRDHRGRSLTPVLVELEGGEVVPVVTAGEGPTLLWVPGLTGDSEVFRYQVAALSARYRVVVPHLRADFSGVEREFDQFARDLRTVMDTLGESSACVGGLSFGGPIAMRFAALFPERVWGLVLTCTLARLDLSHVGLNRTLLIPVARWSSRMLPEPLMRVLAGLWGRWCVWVYDPSAGNERIIDYELSTPVRVPMALGGLRMETFRDQDLRPDLRTVRSPALVIAGASDTYTPIEWQREIAELLPSSTYVEIPFGGHLSLISHAETFNQVVLDWLAGLDIAERRGAALPAAGPE